MADTVTDLWRSSEALPVTGWEALKAITRDDIFYLEHPVRRKVVRVSERVLDVIAETDLAENPLPLIEDRREVGGELFADPTGPDPDVISDAVACYRNPTSGSVEIVAELRTHEPDHRLRLAGMFHTHGDDDDRRASPADLVAAAMGCLETGRPYQQLVTCTDGSCYPVTSAMLPLPAPPLPGHRRGDPAIWCDVTRNILSTDAITVTFSGGTVTYALDLSEWSGCATGAPVSTITNSGTSTSPATTGALSTGSAGDLVLGYVGYTALSVWGNQTSETDGQGNAMTVLNVPTAGQSRSSGSVYLVESGALAYNPTFNSSGSPTQGETATTGVMVTKVLVP